MLTKDSLKTATTVIVGFGIAGLIVGTSQTFQSCMGEHYQYESSKTLYEGAAQFFIAFKVSLGCSGEFVHKNSEAIIALFTIILGIATWLLWRATEDLVKGAETTAEMQLRAYVHIIGKDFLIQDFDNERFTHRFSILNVGQTPAYELQIETVTKPLSHPLPTNFDFSAVPRGNNPSVMMVGPRRRVGHDSLADTILTPAEMADIISADSDIRLYSYGTISYRTFGKRRYTNFCYFLEWEATAESLVFNVHPSEQHNDAD
jgi:hypothetical protein